MSEYKILEIGIGHKAPKFDDSVTLDCEFGPRVDHVTRWGDHPLPFKDNEFDAVYSENTLNCVAWYKVEFALAQVFRVLKRGGSFEVWVPDFFRIVAHHDKPTMPDDFGPFNEEKDFMKWLCFAVFGGERPQEESTWNRCLFSQSFLERLLADVGFVKVQRMGTNGLSFGVVGYKP